MIAQRRAIGTLLSATAMALSLPAIAQAQTSPASTVAGAAEGSPSGDDAGSASAGRLVPLALPIAPNWSRIRSFAGDVAGTSGDIISQSSRIRAFEGDTVAESSRIRAFAGQIQSFASRIRAFEGEMSDPLGQSAAFWGGLRPTPGPLTPNASRIRAFSGSYDSLSVAIRAAASRIRAFDGTMRGITAAPGEYAAFGQQLSLLIDESRTAWGGAVTQRTSKSFDAVFTAPMLAKYGLDLAKPETLNLNEVGIELFLLDWYDNLMNYSGQDQVDHWMKPVNWSPALTQALGSGFSSKIGLLDFTVTGDGTGNIVASQGVSTEAGQHGAAVAGLVIGAHDGRGVMGIAPRASVVAFNPFDSTRTAGWNDIKTGVKYLAQQGATVVNMSLGVPGSTLDAGWNDVFSEDAISREARKRVFVMSAGNDGVVQTQDISWKFDKNPYFIVVGSVDPNNQISSFSNQPGTTCLIRRDKCERADDRLMNRFIVAPGEFILVDDGAGGVTRMSGTSFSAPLVTGTIALIHDRWPWLAVQPEDTVDIVLRSATDLGAPGTDPVYGRGMLNVEAALSPLSWSALKIKAPDAKGNLVDVKAPALTGDRETLRAQWEASGGYFVLFEDTLHSYRDFAVPLSSKLIGQTVGTSGEQFMGYLQSRFWTWLATANPAAPPPPPPPGKFTRGLGLAGDPFSTPVGVIGGLEARMSLAPRAYRPGLRNDRAGYDTALDMQTADARLGFSFGSGDGAPRLGGGSFTLASDFAVETGGANPFLGMASGGGYAAVRLMPVRNLTVSTAFSQQRQRRDFDRMSFDGRLAMGQVADYRADAAQLTVSYRPLAALSTSVSYTLLNESSALLGMQSLDPSDFAEGSRTDAGTFAAELDVASGFSLAGSATMGRSRTGARGGRGIGLADGGLVSTAYQVGLSKVRVFGRGDRIRLTAAQPLHIERGAIEYTAVEVVDRLTGELGARTQTIDIRGRGRRYVLEGLYATSLGDHGAELGLFGRTTLRSEEPATPEAGAEMGFSVRLPF